MQFIKYNSCIFAVYVFNNLSINIMDPVLQHGSSSGYIHDGPDFLIAEQHLQAVADVLADTMGADPRDQ